MPEIQICRYCEDTVRTDDEDYVTINKGDGEIAHAECYEEDRKKEQAKAKEA